METMAVLARTAPPPPGGTGRRPSCAARPSASLSFAPAYASPRGRLALGLSAAAPGSRRAAARARAVSRGIVASSSEVEQSYIMIKPDGVQRGLVGEIISRFEKKGFVLKGLKLFQCPTDLSQVCFSKIIEYEKKNVALAELLTEGKHYVFVFDNTILKNPVVLHSHQLLDSLKWEHYKDLKDKPFFPKLIDYITSGPVVCMAWEGDGVVASARKLIGATNPLQAEPGTIRGDLAVQTGRNVVHGSDSPDNGKREIALWFKEGELCEWESVQTPWLIE